MVGYRLLSCVGRRWIVGGRLAEEPFGPKRPVDFVRRNVQKSKFALCCPRQVGPVMTRGFEHRVGADDVRVYKAARACIRTIYVSLGGKMQNCFRKYFLLLQIGF